MAVDTLFCLHLGPPSSQLKIGRDFREKTLDDTLMALFKMAAEKYNCCAFLKRQENYLKLHVGYMWINNEPGTSKI